MNHRNLIVRATLVLSLAAAGTAAADDPKPDTAGNLTVYDNAGKTVVHVMGCPSGRLGPEWPACIKAAKAKSAVLAAVCKAGVGKLIAGKTYFKYRMGTIKTLIADSVDCAGAGSSSADPAPTAPVTDDTSASADASDDTDNGASKLTGTKTSAAAYSLAGKQIAFETCAKKRGSYDYVACGKAVRASAQARICATRSKGIHKYYYRLGTSRATRASAYCK